MHSHPATAPTAREIQIPGQVAIASVTAFMVIAAGTHHPASLGAQALIVGSLVASVRLPRTWLRRIAIVELPLLAFAVFAALMAGGTRWEFGALSISATGTTQAAMMLVRASMGVALGAILMHRWDGFALLSGLRRLRVPPRLVAITTLTAQFLTLIGAEYRRMEMARTARGGREGGIRAAAAVAGSLGALVVRSMERSERVSRAMVARGFTPEAGFPDDSRPATARHWIAGALLPGMALVAALAGASA